MAGALANLGCPTAGAGTKSLEGGTLIGKSLTHHEFLDVQSMVVFGVGDRRVEHLPNRSRGAAIREVEDITGVLDTETSYEISTRRTLYGDCLMYLAFA